MALPALGLRVLTRQGELDGFVVELIFERRGVDYPMPVSGVVAVGALRSQIVLMNVLVTIRAARVIEIDVLDVKLG